MLFILLSVLLQRTLTLRVPVIIDTAIGSDFDDTMAISYALSRNDVFDIKLILTTTLNSTARAQLLAKFLDVTNRSDVNIGTVCKNTQCVLFNDPDDHPSDLHCICQELDFLLPLRLILVESEHSSLGQQTMI